MDTRSVVITHNQSSSNVTALHPEQSEVQPPPMWPVITPHPDPVGTEVFMDIMTDLQRCLFIGEENALTVVLWVAHTMMFPEFEHTSRLVITAPMKACGKTVLLNVIDAMTNHSIPIGKITPGAFVRLSGRGDLTFCMDEADMLFGKHGGNTDMIVALNNGWEKGGNFIKCTGDHHEPTVFPTHAAVALAGISLNLKLPDTTLDRSMVLRMERARTGQLQQRFRQKVHLPIFRQHGERLLRWCNDHRQQIVDHQTDIPASVEDRTYDKWEPLISIADIASSELGRQSLNIVLKDREVDEDDAKMLLLKDFKAVYDLNGPNLTNVLTQGMRTKGIAPDALAVALCQAHSFEENDDQVWERWNAGKYSQDTRIKGHQVTTLLKEFGLFKVSIRHDNGVFNGFKWDEMLRVYGQWIVPSDGEEYVPGEDWDEESCSYVVDYKATWSTP